MNAFSYFIYFVILPFTSILVSETHSWRCDYVYVKKINGYLKYHAVPTTWRDARTLCDDEGAILASPYPQELHDTFLDFLRDLNGTSNMIFTGIHSIFSKGNYYTLEGTPLSKIPIKWMPNEPDNYGNEEECLILTAAGLAADKKCDNTYPFLCYRKEKDNDKLLGPCGTTDPMYEYNTVTHSCYKFHEIPRSWFGAHMSCSSEGGHLVIVNSDTESRVIKNLLAKHPEAKMVGQFAKGGTFVGFLDWEQDFNWKTIHGERLHEAGFNIMLGNPRKDYHCGCITRDGILFNCNCYAFLAFICEKKPSSIVCADNEDY